MLSTPFSGSLWLLFPASSPGVVFSFVLLPSSVEVRIALCLFFVGQRQPGQSVHFRISNLRIRLIRSWFGARA
jgi:hypothetical protein